VAETSAALCLLVRGRDGSFGSAVEQPLCRRASLDPGERAAEAALENPISEAERDDAHRCVH
jgi:hypothetical protein